MRNLKKTIKNEADTHRVWLMICLWRGGGIGDF